MRYLLIGSFLALSACTTPCQALCQNMADYAEECGFSVPAGDLDACIEAQADSDQQKECRIAGDPQTLRNEWTCDDVAIFFD